MKLKITLLILALILGAAAVFGVIAYINSVRASVEEEVEKVEVLVAAQNIPKETPVETLLEENLVVTKGIPRKYLAEGVLTSLDGYEGYVVANHINEGEQITTTKFSRPEDMGLVFVIPDGMIAVSIPVDEIIGVSNLIDVGDKVNVIATFFPEEDKESASSAKIPQSEGEEPVSAEETSVTANTGIVVEKEITRTLLWNVEVLYIGTRVQTKAEAQESSFLGTRTGSETKSVEIKTVTLAVSPKDSEKLIFTEEMGSVWLALVPVGGAEEEETPGITLDNIFN